MSAKEMTLRFALPKLSWRDVQNGFIYTLYGAIHLSQTLSPECFITPHPQE